MRPVGLLQTLFSISDIELLIEEQNEIACTVKKRIKTNYIVNEKHLIASWFQKTQKCNESFEIPILSTNLVHLYI